MTFKERSYSDSLCDELSEERYTMKSYFRGHICRLEKQLDPYNTLDYSNLPQVHLIYLQAQYGPLHLESS